MEIKRGDIFLVDLNPVIGSEQAGIRPALVIQADAANSSSPHTIIIPFTTRIKNVILPSHVKFSAGIVADSTKIPYFYVNKYELSIRKG